MAIAGLHTIWSIVLPNKDIVARRVYDIPRLFDAAQLL